MIKTTFDTRLREIPVDLSAFEEAKIKITKDLIIATQYADPKAPIYRLADIDYFRTLSRQADLERWSFDYESAFKKYQKISEFWKDIDWPKAEILVELKAALSYAYFADMSHFNIVFLRFDTHSDFTFYRDFFYEFRGCAWAFRDEFLDAKNDLKKALMLRKDAQKKKLIERTEYLQEKLEALQKR